MKRLQDLTKVVIASDLFLPGIVLIFYISFVLIARGTLPSAEELVNLFRHVYREYGYEIIFFSALLESLILINFLVPGSLALAMGAVFAKSGELDLTIIVIIAGTAASLGFIVDYFLGQLGFERIIIKLGYGSVLNTVKTRINVKTLAFAYINPNIGAIFSLAAGILKLPLQTFFPVATVTTFFWFSLWGILFYITGDIVLEIITKYFLLVFLLIVGGVFLVQMISNKKTIDDGR